MSKRRLAPYVILAGLGGALAPNAWADHVALTLGTSGVGVDWSIPISASVHTRIHFSYLRYSLDQEIEDIDYRVKLDNVQYGTLFDWYPFQHGFRLSGGLLAGDYGLAVKAEGEDTYDINDRTYEGEVSLKGEVNFNRVAPFLGIGWGAGRDAKGLSFAFELGVLYLGRPLLNIDARGTARTDDLNNGQPFDVSSYAEFQQDLERERANAQKDVESFRFFPVLNLGLSYTF